MNCDYKDCQKCNCNKEGCEQHNCIGKAKKQTSFGNYCKYHYKLVRGYDK